MAENKQYDVIQIETPNRNAFDLSHSTTTSFNMGNLVPVSVMEVVPGDNFTIGAEALVRFAPLVNPVLHRIDARIEYFFVPNRLAWKNWATWIAQDPNAVGIPAFPTITITAANYTDLMNYMGIPRPIGANTETVSALSFAAYQLIYDQYYRDQNLIPSTFNITTIADGDNTANIANICAMHNRAWEHDLFTSCLPFAQKGNPVTLGTTNYQDVLVKSFDPDYPGPGVYGVMGTNNDPNIPNMNVTIGASPTIPDNTFYADTSTLQNLSITVNELRDSVALQKWLEINARGGTRINEIIKAHFNITPDDARIQRPEYIVGVKTPIAISEVLSTSETVDLPQGNMAGHGIGAITDPNFGSYFAKEHGFIIGIMSIMPKTAYQQGIDKHFLKYTDPTQYYWPTFAHIGEQPVQNREIYAFQGAAGDNTFGYMPAYYDYRNKRNYVTGEFQTSLSSWTVARIFSSPPALNGQFITSDPRTDIFANPNPADEHMYVQVLNKVFCSRLIPEYGTPGLPTF